MPTEPPIVKSSSKETRSPNRGLSLFVIQILLEKETPLFDTFVEAVDTNSDCAFCGKKKFEIVPNGKGFDLVRCTDMDCEHHCHWNHKLEAIQIDLGGPDVISIASGWGK